jgi:hypothetical protein
MNIFNRMNSIKALLTLVAVFTIIVGALPALAQNGDGQETNSIKPASFAASGKLHVPFVRGVGPVPGDMVVDFASQVKNAYADVKWNRDQNTVKIKFHMENLPYRPTVVRQPGTNPKNRFTPNYPEAVENGQYSFWLIATTILRPGVFYYDRQTLDLLGSDKSLASPPADALVLNIPVLLIIQSPLVEPSPNGVLDFTWKLSYDKILDAVGNGGSENAFGPLNLANAGEMSLITTRAMPPGEAVSFDHFLNGIGFIFDTTVEPNPRPKDLDSKFNPMVVNGAMGYIQIPDGFRVDTAVTWQMFPYQDRQGAYTRPLIPGVKIK